MRNKKFHLILILLFAFMLLAIVPLTVHGVSNPTFVTFGDNATCGTHCNLASNGGGQWGFGHTTGCGSAICDQWGVWGTSSALAVTSGDLLVFESINFCFGNSPLDVSRCDITAVSDCLGNTFVATNAGNGNVGTGNPFVSSSVLYSVAAHSGTECATNAFLLTLNCGGCTVANADGWDAEYLIYEYSNALRITKTNFVNTVNSLSTVNAPIVVNSTGDAIMGFAFGDSAIRPVTYSSSQTNQHSWASSNGYPGGDLENLATGSRNYIMAASGTADGNTNHLTLVTAEITQFAFTPLPAQNPTPPTITTNPQAISFATPAVNIGLTFLAAGFIVYTAWEMEQRGKGDKA